MQYMFFQKNKGKSITTTEALTAILEFNKFRST